MAARTLKTYQISANTVGVLAGSLQSTRNKRLIMANLGTNNVFYGTNGVTTSNGAVLRPAANNVSDVVIDTSNNIYLIVASGTTLVSICEIGGTA